MPISHLCYFNCAIISSLTLQTEWGGRKKPQAMTSGKKSSRYFCEQKRNECNCQPKHFIVVHFIDMFLTRDNTENGDN